MEDSFSIMEVAQYSGGSFSTAGDNISALEGQLQYGGGITAGHVGITAGHVGDSFSTVGDNFSTVGKTSVQWGKTSVLWKEHQSSGGYPVQWGKIFDFGMFGR